jgi:hypothetical protein
MPLSRRAHHARRLELPALDLGREADCDRLERGNCRPERNSPRLAADAFDFSSPFKITL